MRTRFALSGLLVVGLVAACSDAIAPDRFGFLVPQFAIAPTVQPNGQFNTVGTSILKGFNPVNPHRGDAIVATFFFPANANIIDSVTDHLTDGTPVGNRYQLVDFVTSGGIAMASYVATNVQNFPDPNLDANGQLDQNKVLVVHAYLSTSIPRGGMTITAYSGVQPTFAQAVGPASHGSGSSDAQTTADPGAVSVNPGALVYAVTLANQVVGLDPPPPPFVNISNTSDGTNLKADAERMTQGGSAGTSHPTWIWGFNASAPGTHPGTWLASVFSLNEAPTASTGNLTVNTSTTGSNLDPDGYTVTVDGGSPQAIGIDGSVSYSNLAAGNHSVAISDVAANCTVSSGNTQTVSVPSGGTATAAFSVSCSATTGNLTVTTSTSGSSLDPDGYTVTVDGGSPQAIGISGSVGYSNLAAGNHTVAISGVAANCTVSGGNSQTVTVPAGGTATAAFSVNCSATTGNLTVNTSTTGSNLDPDGYTVTVDGGSPQAIGINGSVSYADLAAGNHTVAISDVAANCTVSGGNTQTVNVSAGGTAATTFSVSCSATTGNLTVTTSTSGSSLDPDGYTVTVDGGSAQAIGINASVSYSNLTAGNHTVAISGVAANCTVGGGTSRTVSVPSGATATTTFNVTCTTPTGSLTVNTSTSGSSLDPNGYSVTVDGGSPQAIGINASVSYSNLTAGNHTVAISGVAANCTVSGGTSRTVNVPSGATATTTFTVTCTTPTGNLTVSASTTGSGLDSDGYTVTVAGQSKALAINGSVSFTNLAPGSYTAVLSGVAANCTVSGGTSRTVTVPSGGTATASYAVSCTAPNQAPVVNAGPDQTALTGLLYSSTQTFSDANGNGPWSYTIDWGDGKTSTGTRTSQGSFTVGHTYITIFPRSFTIRVTVTDASGASGSDTKVVTVLLL